MSWARVDDGLWEHEKFEALRFAHEYAAGFLWVLAISHCGAKMNPRITVPEAVMLLNCDEATAKQACEVLRSNRLFDTDSASKHVASYIIHDWKHYRSKNEAKVRAGRKGGKKSGVSRNRENEADTKQPRSRPLAELKQTRSPDTDTDTDPDTDPDTDTDTDTGSTPVPWESGSPITSLADLEVAVASWAWTTSLSSSEISKAKRIIDAGAIAAHEVSGALEATQKKSPKRQLAYFLGVVDGARTDARDAPPGAPPTEPKKSKYATREEEQAIVDALGDAEDAGELPDRRPGER